MLLLAAGCASSSRESQPPVAPKSSPWESQRDRWRDYSPWMQPRPTLVFDAAPLLQAERGAGYVTGPPLRWYEQRNDLVPSTFAGYRTFSAEHIHTRTYDRQSIHHGEPSTHYHRRTYRSRVIHTVR